MRTRFKSVSYECAKKGRRTRKIGVGDLPLLPHPQSSGSVDECLGKPGSLSPAPPQSLLAVIKWVVVLCEI